MKKFFLVLLMVTSFTAPSHLLAQTCTGSGCGYFVEAIGDACFCFSSSNFVTCTAYSEEGDWISLEITCDEDPGESPQ